MIKLLLLLSLYLKTILSECLEGCIKCNTRDECEFCDGTNNYILDSITCKKITLNNCLTISTTGNCLVCEEGFYVDKTTLKCAELDRENLIENCAAYASQELCIACDSTHYIKEGKCTALEKQLADCKLADSAEPSKCLECSEGFILHLDSKGCLEATKAEHCAAYSTLNCSQCKTGFVKDFNMYIEDTYKFDDEALKFTVLKSLLNDARKLIDQGVFSICKTVETLNCAVIETFNTCNECNAGYFLDSDKSCVIYPSPRIDFCEKYSNADTCITCSKDKYLLEGVCTDVEPIENCTEYDPSNVESWCVLCKDGFFVRNNGCVERTVNSTFDACLIPDPNADKCQSCNEGSRPTDDGFACLSVIADCLTYGVVDKDADKHLCERCIDGLYWKEDEQKCAPGSTLNCERYEATTPVCIKCKNKFMLNTDDLCVEQNELYGCSLYSPDTEKTCSVCYEKSMLFNRNNGCVFRIEPLDKCLAYSSPTSCAQCEEGFDTNSNGKCIEITSPADCLVKDSNGCLKCIDSKYIDEDKNCTGLEDYFTQECQSNNVDGTKSFLEVECDYCKVGAIPYNYKDSFACVGEALITSKITDCNKYYEYDNGGTPGYKCALCNGSKIVLSDGTCGTDCSSSEALQVMMGENVNSTGAPNYDSYHITFNTKCLSVNGGANEGCSYLYPDLFTHPQTSGEFAYSCAACGSTHVKFILKDTAVITENPVGNLYGSSPVDAFPGVTCTISSSITTLVDNCEYYTTYGGASTSCFKCKFGFHGVVTSDGIISSCVDFSTCEKSITNSAGLLFSKADLGVLKTTWSAYFSCFQCKGDNLPFVALDFSDNTAPPVISEFGLSVTAPALYNTGTGGKDIDCYPIAKTSFGISQDSDFNFPDNCAMGVIDVTSAPNAAESNIAAPTAGKASVFCIACKPGYRPTRVTSAVGLLMVYECTQISNTKCAGSTWFNLCSECAVDHCYKFDPTTKTVLFDSCISFTDSNCYAADDTDPANVFCVYCKKGFSLNIDGKCERINSAKCVGNQFNLNFKFHSKFESDQHAIGMILAPTGSGCQKCESSYLALLQPSTEYVCTTSTYLEAGTFPETTKVIANCVNFTANKTTGDLECKVCAETYILTDEFKCSLQTDSPDCLIALADKTCKTCREGFAEQKGVCHKKEIENCLEYQEGPAVVSQTCLKCAPDYYPFEKKCAKGELGMCKELKNKDECIECQPNHHLIVAKDGKSYCFPIDPELNCETLADKLVDGMVECTFCKFEFSLSTGATAFNSTVCMDFQHTDNCLTYDFTSQISTSTFNCKLCSEDFYVGPLFNCLARENVHKKCIEFQPSADECKKCEVGYFVSPDKLGCTEFPIGVKGCRLYASKTECLGCIENMFLQEGLCVPIEEPKRLAECVYYEDEKNCSLCTAKFAVVEGKCVEAQAVDCLTYDSPTACASCPPDFGFKDEDGIRNCVEKQVSKCVSSEEFFPFKCLVCAKEYFPNDGSCFEVATVIEFCNVYDSGNTCTTCQEGKTLTSDKQFCIDDDFVKTKVDFNCQYSFISAQSNCNKCEKGFIMTADGVCEACTQSTLEDGCYVCNPHDQSKCVLCSPGFYQTKDFVCLPNVSQPEPEEEEKPVTPDEPVIPDEGIGLCRVWGVVVLIGLVLVK